MSVICPAILAGTQQEYSAQVNRIKNFAKRIQIDLTDGEFANAKSIGLDSVWRPNAVPADIHLMYQKPMDYLDQLIKLKPNLVIIHAEADVHHMHFAAELHKEDIKAGLAVLPQTSVDSIEQIINSFDHLLIFSGDLGHFGGKADLTLLSKAREAKEHHPEIEIGWDGGVNDQNAKQLADGGIEVLNVGGFIQNSDDPVAAYQSLLKELQQGV
jgi:ribulose-phosphate 3-epimerase